MGPGKPGQECLKLANRRKQRVVISSGKTRQRASWQGRMNDRKTGTTELALSRCIFLLCNKTIKKRLSGKFRIQVILARPKEASKVTTVFLLTGAPFFCWWFFVVVVVYFRYSLVSTNDLFQKGRRRLRRQ